MVREPFERRAGSPRGSAGALRGPSAGDALRSVPSPVAERRGVTGSRTLIEAMEVDGPFLYFNGVLGRGASRRRHRPEKLIAWLDLARRARVSQALRSDLADFARGRRVAEVVRRAAEREDGWARFPGSLTPSGFSPTHVDAQRVLIAVARELSLPGARSSEIVARWRYSNP